MTDPAAQAARAQQAEELRKFALWLRSCEGSYQRIAIYPARLDALEAAASALQSPQCVTHGDPLVCLSCEAEEDARPEWQAIAALEAGANALQQPSATVEAAKRAYIAARFRAETESIRQAQGDDIADIVGCARGERNRKLDALIAAVRAEERNQR